MRRINVYQGMMSKGGIWIIILVLLTIGISTNASHSAQYWSKTYGGSDFDSASSIQQTTDGGYIVAGNTKSFGAAIMDIWVLKLDNNGNITWQKTYGGSKGDYASSIQQTQDGGYIVLGHTYSFGAGWDDVWVLKLDSSGNVTWQKTYGESDFDDAPSIQQTTDGGYIVAGGTGSFDNNNILDSEWDILVLKLDSNGNITWQKTYGGSSGEYASSIQQTTDGGYIVAGRTEKPFGPYDIYHDILVLKLDSSGNITWQKTYGRSDFDNDASSIQQTTDGGYIVAGLTRDLESADIWVLKLDSSGNVTWQKSYGGIHQDSARSIQQTTDGGYIVAGITDSFGNVSCIFYNFWVLKLDSNGNVSWQKTYNGGSDWETASSIQQTTDGGYIVAGKTTMAGKAFGDFSPSFSDIWILKIDSNGGIHDCDEIYIDNSNASISNTSVSGVDTNVTAQSSAATVTDTNASVEDSLAEVTTLCETDTITCPSEAIYGEYSEETELLRYYRDNLLSKTPEGREIISLYYQWSPLIVEMMENDETMREFVRLLLDQIILELKQL